MEGDRPNIVITFDRLKKRWSRKYRKADVKISLGDDINEMEDFADSSDDASIADDYDDDDDDNASAFNASTIMNSDEDEIITDEEETQNNDGEIIVVEDSVDYDDTNISNNSANNNDHSLATDILSNTPSTTNTAPINKRRPWSPCPPQERPANRPSNVDVMSGGEALPGQSAPKRKRTQHSNESQNAGDKENQSRPLVLPNNNNDDPFFPYGPTYNVANIKRIERLGLRQIIIDGTNIAFGYTKGKVFSVKGLEIAINYFLQKGHSVKAFVPRYRSEPGLSSDPNQLLALQKRGLVSLTPSREVSGRRIICNADWIIIQFAHLCEGIVVSNNDFSDTLQEKPHWKDTIKNRLLAYTWIRDALILPEDPLGRAGPNLDQFLRFP